MSSPNDVIIYDEYENVENDMNDNIYDIDVALEKGFWSNMTLNFESTSTKYIFEINGVRYDFPKMLSFDVDLFEGDKVYTVNYLDKKLSFSNFLLKINDDISVLGKTVGKTIFGRNDLFWFAFDAFGTFYMLDNLNLTPLRRYDDPYRAMTDCLISGKI